MPINNQKMLQSIYDTLFSGYIQPPEGASFQGADPAKNVYLSLEWPGLPILSDDIAGQWSPTNTQGLVSKTEKFSKLVDKIPATSPMFTATGNTVSNLYKAIANAQVTPPPENAAEKKAYGEADKLLWTEGKDYDDNGNEVKVKKPHPMYLAYKKASLNYSNALSAFMAQYLTYDMAKPEDQRKFALLGPSLRRPVDAAMDDWNAAHKTRIEDALAKLAQSSNNQVGVVFSEAQSRLKLLERAGLTDANPWYPTYATPTNWFATSASDIWTGATVSSKTVVKNEHSDYTEVKVDGKASWGLWSGGGGFEKKDGHENMDETTDELEVAFKYAKVDIERPWMNALLFGLKNWHTQGAQKGGYSNGSKNDPGALFPLLPMAFIAVRDVKITAKWGRVDSELITKKLATNANFGWGPFSISGSYASGSTDKKSKSAFDGRTISNEGLQVLAWISSVVPNCPPEDWPKN
jgi:hypothetical protein